MEMVQHSAVEALIGDTSNEPENLNPNQVNQHHLYAIEARKRRTSPLSYRISRIRGRRRLLVNLKKDESC